MIKVIMAMDKYSGIGAEGTLPWPANREDLKFFKKQTSGNIVVMGSNTWNDPCFPAPLKNRKNFVVTSSGKNALNNRFAGAEDLLYGDLAPQLEEMDKNNPEDVWIIGGANVLEQCSGIIQEFYLTVINKGYDCDTFLEFPFMEFEREDITPDGSNNTYLRFYRIPRK